MKKMTIAEIAKATNAKILAKENQPVEKITISHVTQDSREAKAGSLFVPFKGENTDGHGFIADCMQKGVTACFTEQEIEPQNDCVLLLVEQTGTALLALAKYYRDQFDIPFVGITGSVGKTTTKDMVASVVSQKYNTLWTQGNYNNEIGVPLTLFRLKEEHEVAIIEMGMNHFGEIHKLAEVVRPSIALISNVGVAHIEYLGSREGILQAKCEIFDFMQENGVAILNGDNDMLVTLKGKLPFSVQWFGIENKSGIYADNIQTVGLEQTKCTMHTPKGDVDVVIPLPGSHMVLNALSAAAVGLALGLTLEEIKKGIETFVPTKNRMAVIKLENGFTLLNDVYNSNPVSAKASLDILQNATGRKVAVLGFMGELGDFAKQMHEEVGAYAAQKQIDVLCCIGKFCEYMAEGAKQNGMEQVYCFDTQEMFWEKGFTLLQKGDTVLLKASRSMGLEKTVEKLQGVK